MHFRKRLTRWLSVRGTSGPWDCQYVRVVNSRTPIGGSGLPVVIVNQRFATTYWRGEDPLGKRLRLFAGTTPDAWLTVIGVATTRAVVTLVGLRTY